MSQSMNEIDPVTDLIELLNTAIAASSKENEPSENKDSHTLLLVNPTTENYTETLLTLYRHLGHKDITSDQIPPLDTELVNYKYIKANNNEEFLIGISTVEIYTIVQTPKERERSNALQEKLNLLITLEQYSKDIDVLIFTDCMEIPLSKAINNFSDENEYNAFKKNTIMPFIKYTTVPFLDVKDAWKSVTIVMTNVSHWQYNALSMPLIDFIQQMFRSLLIYYTTNGLLLYTPHDIHSSTTRMHDVWKHIFGDVQFELPASFPEDGSHTHTYAHAAEDEPDTIRHDTLLAAAAADSERDVVLLDETFLWSEWSSQWPLLT